MTRFVHQGFLQKFPYEGIDVSQHGIVPEETVCFLDYKEQVALSDATGKCTRTVSLSELDGSLSSDEDWRELKVKLNHVHEIILMDDRPVVENGIVAAYADRTLRVYIQLFNQEGKECLYADCRARRPNNDNDKIDSKKIPSAERLSEVIYPSLLEQSRTTFGMFPFPCPLFPIP